MYGAMLLCSVWASSEHSITERAWFLGFIANEMMVAAFSLGRGVLGFDLDSLFCLFAVALALTCVVLAGPQLRGERTERCFDLEISLMKLTDS